MNADEQALRTRLEERDFQRSFLVEAGAGAGKSHTICQRILHQLLAGQDPGTIAAITFTEKAALELQEKLDRQALAYDRAHGTGLAALTAKVHISTIHSFCQTALGLFPLETGGELQVLPDDSRRARDFFRAWTARDEDGASSAFEAFGGAVRTLEDTFAAMAGEDHVPARPAAADVKAHQSALDRLTDRAHQALQKHLLPHSGLFAYLPEELRQAAGAQSLTPELSAALRRTLKAAWKVQTSRPKRLRTLFFTEDSHVSAWLEEYIEASKQHSQRMDPTRLGKVPPIFAAMDAFQAELDKDSPTPSPAEALLQAERLLGYDLALNVLAPALEAYLAERDRAGLVTFSGLLTRTRDLVRDNPAARALLHRRYQVFYVDEFQDTDPVQAELLFLITDQGGTETDWKRCHPTPGSLFLVGDPKQAIYRFRGADLGVYKQIRDLFTSAPSPVGEVVCLRANFRSAPEICSFVDRVFAPKDEKTGNILTPAQQAENRKNKTVTEFLDDGAYQAPYVPMEAQQKRLGRGAVFSYESFYHYWMSRERHVATFIQQAVARGFTLPDRDGNPVPVRYRDFLILTWRKSTAGAYLDALTKLGVPVSFSGSRSLAKSPQMKRLAAWLQWLLEPGDEIALLAVLMDCFGLRNLERVRRLKAASPYPLTALAGWREKRDEVTDPALKPLLDALAEMDAVRADCRALPPMAFLEKLAEARLFRMGDAADPQERERQYGDVRLLLSQLRQHGDFPALARAALTLCQGAVERELPLTPSPDAVRVMNLHKAKGLEGKIVILVPDDRANIPPHKAGDIYPIFQTYAHGNSTLLYAPKEWREKEKEEKDCLAAEWVRLNYVAATRTEQLLLIAGGKVKQKKKSCWDAMAGKAPRASLRNPQWGRFIALLVVSVQWFLQVFGDEEAGNSAGPALHCAAQPESALAAGLVPQDLTDSRESRILAQSIPASLRASPSTLDKSHPVPRSPDPEEPPEDSPAPVLEEGPEGPEAPAREENAPRGADWGTAVHRAMELCVSQKAWDAETARPLIAQALRETLPPLSRMTGTQKRLLFGGELPESDAAGAGLLAGQLEEAISFWFDENSPLRRLTGAGTCYCELPFHLTLSREDESWRFLRDRLDCREDFAGSIHVSGILDLAILTEEGWHIVDYKTDRLRPGEEAAAYRRRLAGEYEAQLNAYTRILSRLSGKAVLDARLCAIPLGGEWIPVSKGL